MPVIKKKQWSHHSVHVTFPSLWVRHLEENGKCREVWQPRFPSGWWKRELSWGYISPWDGDTCFNCGIIPAQSLRLKMFPSCIQVRQQIAKQNAENALNTSGCPGDSSVSTSDLSSRLNQGISEMGGSHLCKTQILHMHNCTGEI